MKLILKIFITTVLSVGFVMAQQGRSGNSGERTDKDDVKSISGTITKVSHPYATLKADGGKEYQVHLGPIWYWNRSKLEIKVNVKTKVYGEVEELKGVYHFYPWEIVQDGKSMTLADENGVPKWSGGKTKLLRYKTKDKVEKIDGNNWYIMDVRLKNKHLN